MAKRPDPKNYYSYLGRFIEGCIVVIIIFAIMQTFFEEYATFAEFNRKIRLWSLIASFAIDIIFSIEFLARLVISARRERSGAYLAREGGIIDFISSWPLLIFNSGPLIYVSFFSGEAGIISTLGVFSFLKIVKIIRVVRTLRFVRALKIFYRVKKRVVITPRYVSAAALIALSVIIGTLIGFSFIHQGNIIQPQSRETERILRSYIATTQKPNFKILLQRSNSVLFIRHDKKIVYQKITPSDFNAKFLNDDYYKKTIEGWEIFFNNKDAKQINSFINMLAFTMMLGIILFLITFFRHYFSRHITSVLTVMIRGFTKESYLTPVRIDNKRASFEPYQLASQYNRKWLPLKRKIIEIKRGR